MKIAELEKVLSERGVQARSYSIEGRTADEEQYRLERSGNLWSVYYYERGNQNDLRYFEKEDEAADFFLNLLMTDPTTRR
jgi:hypothetical protein